MNVIEQLRRYLNDTILIVLCGRSDDAQAWEDAMGHHRCVAIAADARKLPKQREPASRVGDLIDSVDLGRAAAVMEIDRSGEPAPAGRRLIGERQPVWRLFEDKTIIDCLWDHLGIPRPPSIIGDHLLNIGAAASTVNEGSGAVCAIQEIGQAPTSSARGIWWWTDHPPVGCTIPPGYRAKVTPMLPGQPVRLHGLVTRNDVYVFPPMEVVTLRRLDSHEFLCCGCVPMPTIDADLQALTHRLGAGIRAMIGYLGVFSVDGIVTDEGFRPTDLNTRLTSAIEAAPPAVRVRIQAANVCAREGLDIDRAEIDDLCSEAFRRDVVTIYGASRATAVNRGQTPIYLTADRLIGTTSSNSIPLGSMVIAPSPRGWTVTAQLRTAETPGHICSWAPAVFGLSDTVFGTTFGDLGLPFGTPEHSPTGLSAAGGGSP